MSKHIKDKNEESAIDQLPEKDKPDDVEKAGETSPDPAVALAELEGRYKRALADYQNLLKRTVEEKKEFAKFANEQFILEILPVYDNLKISLDHLDEAARSGGWAEGIRHVIRQFSDILNNQGVQEIEAQGKKFDPAAMDALEGEGNTVTRVVKPGYAMRGKVIMPAKVVLGDEGDA